MRNFHRLVASYLEQLVIMVVKRVPVNPVHYLGNTFKWRKKSDERLNEPNSGQYYNIYVHENSDGKVYR